MLFFSLTVLVWVFFCFVFFGGGGGFFLVGLFVCLGFFRVCLVGFFNLRVERCQHGK